MRSTGWRHCRASRRSRSADSRPPQEAGQTNNFDLEDRPTPPGENQPLCTWVGVSPGFFKTVGLTLERGRLLDERSLQDNVVVVDRAWADRFFPGEEVLGRRFKNGGCTTCPWTTVVGVVGTVKWIGLEAPDPGTVYFPFVDLPDGYFVLRTAGRPSSSGVGPASGGARARPGARALEHRDRRRSRVEFTDRRRAT